MSIESIQPIVPGGINEIASATANDQGQGFSNYIDKYYQDVNTMINDADTKLRQYAIGEPVSIHEVMLSISKAKTAFELGLQVRNKLVEGYQEIMRMQV